MKRVELFAYPAWHSLSPAMHNAAFAARGIAARYEAREVHPDDLSSAVESLRGEDVLGANVTIPHKERVVPLLDHLSQDARAVGAVNTVVSIGSELHGHNTDVSGFSRALAETGFDPHDRDVLLLGAGGAARAVAYALLSAGVSELMIHNRTLERAQALAVDLGTLGEITVLDEARLARRAREASLIVNATSVGMLKSGLEMEETPLDASLLPDSGVVIDLIYRPARTRLLREAQSRGLATQNGLPMLVHQGAESFTMWTGEAPPLQVMMDAALTVLQG